MFRILGRTSGNLVGVDVTGELTPDDFAALRDELRALVDDHEKVRLLFDLADFTGFEVEALWDEHSFSARKAVERVALVVANEHAERARAAFGLDAAQTRVFEPGGAEQAWR